MPRWLPAALLLCSPLAAAGLADAIAALNRGDWAAAERELRAEVASHPTDAPSLSLLGVALDRQNRLREADPFHRRALEAAPQSIDVLGNWGNHLTALGEAAAARRAYLKIAALDPANPGANLQLTRLALKRQDAAEARRYLALLPDTALADPGLSFSLAVDFANVREFRDAESLFTRALATNPADFNILYNLGVVAIAAGDFARARDVLDTALRQQPDNPDVLFHLAEADRGLGRNEHALELLAHAARLVPERADIRRLIALTAANLGALEDALASWDRYLKLSPADDAARRERAVAAIRLGRTEEGIAALKTCLEKHPADPAGHFELGVALGQSDPAAAVAEFDRALSLRPDLAPALYARGNLRYQQGRPEAALPDLESAARLQPDDPATLDRLGQTYLSLDRLPDAVRVLRRAATLAPNDSTVQLHYGRALAQAGDAAESKAVMDRFRQLGPPLRRAIPAGFLDYLALTPDQRRADYRARVEKAVRENPTDSAAQLDYLNLVLDDGKLPEATLTARKLAALHPAPTAALALANARLLEAQGKPEDALAALSAVPADPQIRWRQTAILVRLHRTADALRLLNQSDDESQLLQAAVLKISARSADAQSALDALARRRPEWHAITFVRSSSPAEIETLLQQKPPSDW